MRPIKHLLIGTIFALLIFLVFPSITWIGFVLIVLSTFLIDVDHYLYYVYRKKDLSLRRAYYYFINCQKKIKSLPVNQRAKVYEGVFIFHGIEAIILSLFLSLFCKYFLYIAIGISFHLFLDLINQRKYHKRIDKISLIYDFIKFKRLKSIC